MIKIFVSEEQRKELENFRRQSSAKDSEKALMILMNAEGLDVAKISLTLKRNPHTVRDWLKRYKAKGLSGLSRKYSPGRPDEKRRKVKEHIAKILPRSPKEFSYTDAVWTVPLIAYDINKKCNISTSIDTVIRALNSMGYVYKRPSKTVSVNAPGKEEKIIAINKMIAGISEIVSKKDSTIYALDESHFSTEPYLVQGWFKKRWPPYNTNSKQKGKSHILWMLEYEDSKILLEAIKSRHE